MTLPGNKRKMRIMNLKIKAIALSLLLLATSLLATGCGEEASPYERNDAENYSVSVKYDANGGFFTTNTAVIVDSYNVADMEKDSDGNAQIPLIAPDDAAREKNAFAPINNGYFLAGWYAERTETGKDDAGNPIYTYGKKWDFEKDMLSVDTNQAYTSAQPVLTLYAAWIPMFEIEIYDAQSGELMTSVKYDPTAGQDFLLPVWDEETGAIEMNNFPEKSGYTFKAAYYDKELTKKIDTDVIAHPGTIDPSTGTATDQVMALYADWTEGEWFHIYNVEQFLDNASVSGCYEIHADLDFTGENWPTTLMHGSFSGTIRGNGHTFKNVELTQTNNSKTNSGLFGQLAETAVLENITFENVTFTIKGGTRMAGTTYGLLAGAVSDKAVCTGVKILTSTLQIDSSCYFGTDDYTIGLVCGMGSTDIDPTGITCKAVGDKPESVIITVTETTVTVEFVTG